MGVDMATYGQLIAHKLKIEQICQHVGADSLAYLSLPGMLAAIEELGIDMVKPTEPSAHSHCTACFSGEYPIPIPAWLFQEDRDKMVFETVWGKGS
jgi:amidophosphoribosyltransferase